jgi:hypothetical protein
MGCKTAAFHQKIFSAHTIREYRFLKILSSEIVPIGKYSQFFCKIAGFLSYFWQSFPMIACKNRPGQN